MTYLEWNDKLAAHFFRPEMAGRQVFLFVTEDLLDELGAEIGDNWCGFVNAVKAGHPWLPRLWAYISTACGVCQQAYLCFKNWRNRDANYPPYIAYLCLFVLAAGKEGDFAPNAYYPRLRILIDEEGDGILPDFDRMSELWEDLERWANYEKRGELGNFTFRRVGGYRHVGVPLAQTILTEAERRYLPRVFAEAQLDPTSLPSDVELQAALRTHGSDVLGNRTLSLLSSAGDREMLNELLAITREALEQWDGLVVEADQGTEPSVYGNLRLCATLDSTMNTVRFTLRSTMNRDFPTDGLVLERPGSDVFFFCEGELLQWSTPLEDRDSRARIDGARFDWNAGIELREKQLGWRFRLRACPVRIFRNGAGEGLRGLVEVHHMSPRTPFVLAATYGCRTQLEAWGRNSCIEFERIPIRLGLPEGWDLYKAAAAISDEQVRSVFPFLTFPHSVRLLMRNGIRSRSPNSYFSFGVPVLLLEGGRGDETVAVDCVSLQPDGGVYHLPTDLSAGAVHTVEVRRGEEVLRRQSFWLVDDFDWRSSTPHQLFGRFGESLEEEAEKSSGVAGAALIGVSTSEPFFSPPVSCFEGRRVFFIGSIPGQIVSWPSEDLPADWIPVWAIPMTERGHAIFCGIDLRGAEKCELGLRQYGTKQVRLWKEVLFYRRKKITPPSAPKLQRLLRQYQEVARHVRA